MYHRFHSERSYPATGHRLGSSTGTTLLHPMTACSLDPWVHLQSLRAPLIECWNITAGPRDCSFLIPSHPWEAEKWSLTSSLPGFEPLSVYQLTLCFSVLGPGHLRPWRFTLQLTLFKEIFCWYSFKSTLCSYMVSRYLQGVLVTPLVLDRLVPIPFYKFSGTFSRPMEEHTLSQFPYFQCHVGRNGREVLVTFWRFHQQTSF